MELQNMFKNESNAKSFTSGQPIFNEGDQAEEMYIVIQGQVDILYDGRVLETVETGGVLGELALIDNSPRSATAIAKTDCRIAGIDQRRFTFLIQEHPYFALHIMTVMANRLRRQTT